MRMMMLCLCLGCSSTPSAPAQEGESRGKDFLKVEPGSPRLEFVTMERVRAAESIAKVSLTGRIAFDEDRTQRLASPIDGRVIAIRVQPGDRVRVGQPLIELSSPHVGLLQADAQKAQQDLTVAQKAIERVRKLREDNAVSDKEVAQAEADFNKARSELARTGAQLKSLGVSASEPAVNVSLRAQLAGTVVDRAVLAGQEVRADQATPLITLSNLESVWVLADVYEQDLALVQKDARVDIKVPAYPAESFPGKVGYVGDVVDATSRTVKLRCIVPNPGGRLKPEMFARLELSGASAGPMITVPSRALVIEGDRAQVIVATEGNIFRARRVDLGPEIEGRVRVLRGLSLGETIVTDGAIFLKREIDSP